MSSRLLNRLMSCRRPQSPSAPILKHKYRVALPQHSFMQSSTFHDEDPLPRSLHDKWGFVICRTTYKSETDWSKFKDLMRRNIARNIRQAEMTEEDAQSYECTFLEDPILDGQSRDFLRQYFRRWADQAVIAENPRAVGNWRKRGSSSRYTNFIYVDEEALQSVVRGVDKYWDLEDHPLGGYVHVVDENWVPLTKEGLNYDPDDEETYEEIDGSRKFYLGWTIVPAWCVGPDLWGSLGMYLSQIYVRPPEIVDF